MFTCYWQDTTIYLSYLTLCGPHGIVWACDGINFTSNLYTAAECLITILEVECSTTQSFIIIHDNLCPVYLNIHGWNVFHFTRNHFVCFNESIIHSNITLTRIHNEFVWITSSYTGCTLWSLLYQYVCLISTIGLFLCLSLMCLFFDRSLILNWRKILNGYNWLKNNFCLRLFKLI